MMPPYRTIRCARPGRLVDRKRINTTPACMPDLVGAWSRRERIALITHHAWKQSPLGSSKKGANGDKIAEILDKTETHSDYAPDHREERQPYSRGCLFDDQVAWKFASRQGQTQGQYHDMQCRTGSIGRVRRQGDGERKSANVLRLTCKHR